jgi:hypothetical protein
MTGVVGVASSGEQELKTPATSSKIKFFMTTRFVIEYT